MGYARLLHICNKVSRIRLCELVVCEGVEDPLDDLGTLKQMMELLTIQSKDSAGSFGGPQETHLDEFRKACISDRIQRESRVHEKLSQEFGVADDSAALKLYAIKVITNLQYWGKDKKLLSTTLALLDDLTVAFTNVRRLLKTDEIIQLLENHSVTFYNFLS
uniref:Exportin-7/Ran-binding protein 17 TPR repeats domain-containing protein n=1 Tax=Ditylenchus dipsaci TaxID=166011 RepID=A0A915CWF1_9BILA